MRIRIRHETEYRYDEPAKWTIHNLRMTPRDYDGQHIGQWRIEIDHECRLRESEDAFGNRLHRVTTEGPITGLRILVEGEATTFETTGVASGVIERLPKIFFLRETALTTPDPNIAALAREAAGEAHSTLDRLHRLLAAVHGAMRLDEPPVMETQRDMAPAGAALARGSGLSHDFAHLFITCARVLQIPARCISGYCLRGDVPEPAIEHAWAEACVEDLGWVGFDPMHGVSPCENYLRVAAAPDYLGAAPVRDANSGGTGEHISTRIHVYDGFGPETVSRQSIRASESHAGPTPQRG